MNNKLVIFGYPRSGTKLLADIYSKNGYHNFGEFLNIQSAEIVPSEFPYAKRMEIHKQKFIKNRNKENHQRGSTNHIYAEMMDRFNIYNRHSNISPSIMTVWPETFNTIPNLISKLEGRYFLCTRRKNKFEQFLSRLVTFYECNYNGEVESTPVLVDMTDLTELYISFIRAESLQDTIVSSGLGRFINFDDLIAGTFDLGFPYTITSNDQHINITQYIQNLDEVKLHICKLQNFMVV